MINANELRIGNKVGAFLKGVLVATFTVDRIEKENFSAIFDGKGGTMEAELLPIPLTDEILKRCGFEWQPEEKDVYGKKISGSWRHEAYEEYPGLFYLPSYIPKHLHQIQNLYFAITGTELQISL